MGILFRIHAAPLYDRASDAQQYKSDDAPDWPAYDPDLSGQVPATQPRPAPVEDDPE